MSSETPSSIFQRNAVREAIFAFGTLSSVLVFCFGLIGTILAMSLGLRADPVYPIPVPNDPTTASLTFVAAYAAVCLAVILAGVGVRRARPRVEEESHRHAVFAVGTGILGAGIYLLLLMFAAGEKGSAPFFASEFDKMLLLAFGLVAMYAGYWGIRFSRRWVGWK